MMQNTSNQSQCLFGVINTHNPTRVIDPSNQNSSNISKDGYIEVKIKHKTPRIYKPIENDTTTTEDTSSTQNCYAALAVTAVTHNYLENEASNFAII